MSSEGPQDTPEQGQATPDAGLLAQRLLAPGVVDVTAVRKRHDRAAAPAERSRTIGRLLSRYCPADAQNNAGNSLVFRSAARSGAKEELVVAEGFYAAREPGSNVAEPARPAAASHLRPGPAESSVQKKELNQIKGAEKATASQETKPNRDGQVHPLQRVVQRSIAAGLIDGSQAQRQFERIANPVPDRAGLVNRLQSRGVAAPFPGPLSSVFPAESLTRKSEPGKGQAFVSGKDSAGMHRADAVIAAGAGAEPTTSASSEISRSADLLQRTPLASPMQRADRSSEAHEPDIQAGQRSLKELFRRSGNEQTPDTSASAAPGPTAPEVPQKTTSGPFRIMRKKPQSTERGADTGGKQGPRPASDVRTASMPAENGPGPEITGGTVPGKELSAQGASSGTTIVSGPILLKEIRPPAGADGAATGTGLVLRKATESLVKERTQGNSSEQESNGFSASVPEATKPNKVGENILLRKPGRSETESSAPSPAQTDHAVRTKETSSASAEGTERKVLTTTRAGSESPLLMRSPVAQKGRSIGCDAAAEEATRSGKKADEASPGSLPTATEGTASFIGLSARAAEQHHVMRSPIHAGPGTSGSGGEAPLVAEGRSPSPDGALNPLVMRSNLKTSLVASGSGVKTAHAFGSTDGLHNAAGKQDSSGRTEQTQESLPSVQERTSEFKGTSRARSTPPLLMRSAAVPASDPGKQKKSVAESGTEQRREISGSGSAVQPYLLPLVVQRMKEFEQGIPVSKETGSLQRSVTPVATVQGQDKSPQTTLIWRKSELQRATGSNPGYPSVITGAGEGAVQRSATPPPGDAATGSSQGIGLPSAGSVAGALPALDLNVLAEQVSRLLFRRLETARERRGVGL